MNDSRSCKGCGGTGTKWDKERNDWGTGTCEYCDGHGFTPEVDFDANGETFA